MLFYVSICFIWIKWINNWINSLLTLATFFTTMTYTNLFLLDCDKNWRRIPAKTSLFLLVRILHIRIWNTTEISPNRNEGPKWTIVNKNIGLIGTWNQWLNKIKWWNEKKRRETQQRLRMRRTNKCLHVVPLRVGRRIWAVCGSSLVGMGRRRQTLDISTLDSTSLCQ